MTRNDSSKNVLEVCSLKPKNQCRNGRQGYLPSPAPLANPYVPYQVENPPRYEARKALVRGTMYPGLDLPFMGMVNRQEKPVTPISELQSMAFAIQELALYLDTHHDDKEALELYRSYQKMYHKGSMVYAKERGPMNHMTPGEGEYEWIHDPWPWEYAANREV